MLQPATGLRSTSGDLPALLLRVAWSSVALGFAMQVLTSVAAVLAGATAGSMAEFIRDGAQKVSWSTFVCMGLALGTTASKARAAWTGIAGLLAAPLGMIVARAAQKGVGAANGAAAPEVAPMAFWIVLSLKGLQYGLFGAVLAQVAGKAWGGLMAHICAGLFFGVVFGGTVVATLFFLTTPTPPTPKVVAQLVNEIIFPIGCAIVLYAAMRLGKQLKSA